MRIIRGSMLALFGVTFIMIGSNASLFTIVLTSTAWVCTIQIAVSYFAPRENPVPNEFNGVHLIGCAVVVVITIFVSNWGFNLGMMLGKKIF